MQYEFSIHGHALKIVKPKEADIDTFFADIKTFAMKIGEIKFK